MIVYSSRITPRLHYIVNFFSEETGYEKWAITTNIEEFIRHDGVKINYSKQKIDCNCIHMVPHSLLFEQDIRQQQIACDEKNGVKVFFRNESQTGFDVFAATFFLLTRYEEYLPHNKDNYGRYCHTNSLAFKEDFLKTPLINIWIENLKQLILQKFPGYIIKEKQFKMLPTYDIDMAWSYLHKGFLRNTGNLAKDFLSLRLYHFARRCKVLAGLEKDPFDTFEWLDKLHEEYSLEPFYFFLVAEKLTEKDKNISPHQQVMQRLIKNIERRYSIGLHPSWRSNSDTQVLAEEKNILENISDREIVSSRQHYIMLSFPETYRNLLKAGIKADHSMGYAAINGFRASVASPFLWYDLANEKETSLMVYPFCFMEGNSIFYLKQTPAEGLEEMKHLYNEVRAVNGFFSMIWHNSTFNDDEINKGWKEVYTSFLQYTRG